MSIFGDLERFASDLYPYRWPITIAVLIVIAAFVAFAYRQGWHRTFARHWLATALVAVPLVAVVAPAGWYALSPLWERTHLEEASPLAPAPDAQAEGATPEGDEAEAAAVPTVASGPAAAPAFEPRVVQQGEFVGADDFHFGRGAALLIETEPGRYTLRFEEFSVRNGPDLFVYLSPDGGGYAEGAINLGELKATDGAFNYEVPAGTDVSQFKSAVVWCREFAVLFATATFGTWG
ncbi:MAG: DM13 domain-containing protein [Dehalococcoidia bacterium]